MSGNELQPRKVQLMRVHNKNATTTVSILYITMEPVNTSTKQPYYIDIFISYKVTTECIRLILEVEQFDISSDSIVPIPYVLKVSCYFLLSFFRASSLRHSMKFPLSISASISP